LLNLGSFNLVVLGSRHTLIVHFAAKTSGLVAVSAMLRLLTIFRKGSFSTDYPISKLSKEAFAMAQKSRMLVTMPAEVQQWLRQYAEYNGGSLSGEVVRALREKMERAGVKDRPNRSRECSPDGASS
jgi:hypothetical protein